MSSPFPSGMSFSKTVITPCDAVTASMAATVAVPRDYGDDVVDVELDVDVEELEVVEVLDDDSGTVVVVVVGGGVVVVASTMRCPKSII